MLEENVPESAENEMPHEYERKYIFWASYFKNLEGRILTVIDASLPESKQQKAVKDLIRQTIWRWAEDSSWCTDCENGRRRGDLPKKEDKNYGSTDGDKRYHAYCKTCNVHYDL